MMKRLLLLVLIVCSACGSKIVTTEKVQQVRTEIVQVKELVKSFAMDDVLISSSRRLNIAGDYLFIQDYKSFDRQIHLFDRTTLRYIASTGTKGQGPGEITNMGALAWNDEKQEFYVTDHGPNCIYRFDMDSVLNNPYYTPSEKSKITNNRFPSRYTYLNDTLCFGLIIEPTGKSGFNQTVGKWSMQSGEIQTMAYTHPAIERKRVDYALSQKYKVYAEVYAHHDLITINNWDGELVCNIYGPEWNSETSNKMLYFSNPIIYEDKLLVCYSGNKNYEPSDQSGIAGYTSKIMVFSLNGDYLKTLETGYHIIEVVEDYKNQRLVMALDDADIEFATLDLKGLI
ncbi:MAG: 6-bladed beta-propeller [Tannerellaceae bacterium]